MLVTVSLRVPWKLIRIFSIFNVSKALRSSPSWCSTVANNIYQFMDVFSTVTSKTISLDDLVLGY
jgi:hypothetical protein